MLTQLRGPSAASKGLLNRPFFTFKMSLIVFVRVVPAERELTPGIDSSAKRYFVLVFAVHFSRDQS